MATNRNATPQLAGLAAGAILRARELESGGMSRTQIVRWVNSGQLRRVGRGLYTLPDREIGEHESLVLAAKQVPRGIVCLLTALTIHGLTTQNPPDVLLALPRTARSPRVDWPPLRLVRWSGRALTAGVVEQIIDGVSIHVTTPARSVADCFKHRSLVGVDVAVEALRAYRTKRAGTLDELQQAAGTCRMQRVMQPYLEAVL